MRGKEVILVLAALLLLLIFPSVNSQDSIVINAPENRSIELPEAVQDALEDYVELKRIEIDKIEQARNDIVRKEKFEKMLFSAGIGIAIILLFVIAFFLVHNRVLPRMKRKFRRQMLYFVIIKMYRKGFTGKEILRILTIKRYNKHHVNDVLARYKDYQLKKKSTAESEFNFLRGNRNVRAFFRKIRRQYLFFRLITSTKYVRRSLKEARDRLIKKGWSQVYVDDAYTRYKTYLLEKRGFFVRFLGLFLGSRMLHKVRRRLRRQVLYPKIKKLLIKGMDHKQIVRELSKKGWQEKYIMDAYIRYKDFHKKEDIPKQESFIWRIWPLSSIGRRMQRRRLLSEIRKLRLNDLGQPKIINTLVDKGWSRQQITDALFLYEVYHRNKK